MNSANPSIREPAVAGMFYPADRTDLRREINRYLKTAQVNSGPQPKALIVPHAGYVYSGQIAATAYAQLVASCIKRVVLMGPAHTLALRGLASPGASSFRTPLGEVTLDVDGLNQLEKEFEQVKQLPEAHIEEHSLEVQLPFLQEVLEDFELLPFALGDSQPAEVAEILESCWGGAETLILISSDLSHFLSYKDAKRMDERTALEIENFNIGALGTNSACGRHAINGLLSCAQRRGMQIQRLDLRNSGDTAGPRDRVVGYGAWAFYES